MISAVRALGRDTLARLREVEILTTGENDGQGSPRRHVGFRLRTPTVAVAEETVTIPAMALIVRQMDIPGISRAA